MQTARLTKYFYYGFLVYILIPSVGFSQTPVKAFTPGMYSPDEYNSLRQLVGKNKNIPDDYEKQMLIALSYFPELADIKIEFRFKRTNTSFSTRPTILSVFKRSSHRKYIITISDSCEAVLLPLMFKNLPYNAQIGVMSHELSHAADFTQKNSFGLMRVAFGNLSNKYLDKLERKTDSLCIAHGAGYQLLAWSSFIRDTMHRENWTGSVNIDKGPMVREKYMNPSTIMKKIEQSSLYIYSSQ